MSVRIVVDNEKVVVRTGTTADAPALHELIGTHADEGHLLPRTLAELAAHAPRFVVVERGSVIVACAELASLSSTVAEVRSLVVDVKVRGLGLASRMVGDLIERAHAEGFSSVSAFAHDPAFFVGLGFSIVPHTWIPEKIAHDCAACPLFRACGQYALTLKLAARGAGRSALEAPQTCVMSHAH